MFLALIFLPDLVSVDVFFEATEEIDSDLNNYSEVIIYMLYLQVYKQTTNVRLLIQAHFDKRVRGSALSKKGVEILALVAVNAEFTIRFRKTTEIKFC